MIRYEKLFESIQYSDLSNSNLYCGEAVLESFNITVRGLKQTCQANVLNQLEKHGYKTIYEHNPWDKPVSLKRFIQDYPMGNYYIYTDNHSMSLHDGVLTDTEKGSLQRKVKVAWRVI